MVRIATTRRWRAAASGRRKGSVLEKRGITYKGLSSVQQCFVATWGDSPLTKLGIFVEIRWSRVGENGPGSVRLG